MKFCHVGQQTSVVSVWYSIAFIVMALGFGFDDRHFCDPKMRKSPYQGSIVQIDHLQNFMPRSNEGHLQVGGCFLAYQTSI